MLGLADVLADLVDLAGNSRGVLDFAAVDGLGLDAVVDLRPCDVVRGSAHSGDGLNVRVSTGGADDSALQIGGGVVSLVAHEGTSTVVVVVAQAADAVVGQVSVPALEGIGSHQLHAVLVVVHDVGHVHDADVVDVAGQTACVGQDGDAHALQSLIDHVFLTAQLAGRIDGDLHMAVGVLSDLVGSSLQALIDHGSIGLGGGELQLKDLTGCSRTGSGAGSSGAGGRSGRTAAGGQGSSCSHSAADSEKRTTRDLLHVIFPPDFSKQILLFSDEPRAGPSDFHGFIIPCSCPVHSCRMSQAEYDILPNKT